MWDFQAEQVVKDNYHDIYLHNLIKHEDEFMFENAPRGFKQRERLFTAFTLTNPIERVCYSAERKVNINFLFAEVLWYLKGSNSLDFIAYYCPRMRRYSRNGKTLDGSAYGTKIFSWGGHINQWQWVHDELNSDPHSRRAVIHIRGPEEMLVQNNIDATCTLTLQFLNREDHLILISSMRSNDFFRGALSDVFSFTFLQELMANQLDLKLGTYHHQVGSSHVYESDKLTINKVRAKIKPRTSYQWTFPAMPTGNNWPAIETVLAFEERLRKNDLALSVAEISQIDVPDYWRQVTNLFEIQRQIHYEGQIISSHYDYLLPLYQYMTTNRFVKYLPQGYRDL
jgi:thymidylate synthase